jgi:IS5 family transposase
MLKKKENPAQLGFYSSFEEQLNRTHELYILSNEVNWKMFDDAFEKLYCEDNGAPAKPIRLMVGLILLKHIRDLSDESVVQQWSENVYYQYFTGEQMFASGEPCDASELVHFRNRIGTEGAELIFKESIRINGSDADEGDGIADTTAMEKNITFPTDTKLHRKIIKKCIAIADQENIELRQRYTFVLKKLVLCLRYRKHPKNKAKAKKAEKKIKTIATRLVSELERKLSPSELANHAELLTLFKKVLKQEKNSTNKIYSLHEPDVYCMSKGKENKTYEFGSKVAFILTKTTGVFVGALNMPKNDYDGHTLEPALKQYERLTGKQLKNIYADRGYKGVKQVGETKVNIPKPLPQSASEYEKSKTRKNFRRRASIEPKIGHLKQDHRLNRNFYKGIKGDDMNVLLACAAMNFKRMMNKWKMKAKLFFDFILEAFCNMFFFVFNLKYV